MQVCWVGLLKNKIKLCQGVQLEHCVNMINYTNSFVCCFKKNMKIFKSKLLLKDSNSQVANFSFSAWLLGTIFN